VIAHREIVMRRLLILAQTGLLIDLLLIVAAVFVTVACA
jgi:hypothetical protein